MKRLFNAAVALVCLTVMAGPAIAQPLAERVPADALLYVGWVGSTELGEAYDNSHLKPVLADSGIPAMLDQTLGKLIERVPEPEPRKMLGMLHATAGQLLRHPTALYVTHRGKGEGPPGLMLLCDAGDEVEAVSGALNPMVQQLAEQGAPIGLDTVEGLVTLRVMAPVGPVDQREKSLAADERMSRSVKRTGVAPTVVAYADGAKLLALAEKAAQMEGNVEQFRQTRDLLALDGIKSIALAGGFADRDWATGLYVEAPEPRKGLAAMLDGGEPLSEGAMKLVPRTAALAGGGKLDLAGLHDAIMAGVAEVEPETAERAEAMGERITEGMGFDIRDDLLAGLGDEWLWYIDRHVAGTGSLGMVMVNPLRKPAAAERAMERLLGMGNAILAQQMRDESFKLEIRKREVDGVAMHYAAMPMISPTMAFHEGRLYLGLFPQSIAGALAHEQADGSILDNAAFKRRRAQVKAKGVTGFEYVAADELMAKGYPTMMLLGRSFAGFADMAGGEAPARLMPKLSTLHEHAAPTGTFTWADDTGFYSRSRSFMPGAAMLGGMSVSEMTGVTSLAAGIILPAIGRARELAQRTASAAQLRGIGQSCILYAHEHNGQLPSDVGELVAEGYADAELFVDPRSNKTVPRGLDRDELADWVRNNSDYVYLANGREATISAKEVLAYERPSAPWTREGINMAFMDGHAKWVERAEAMKLIEKAKKEVEAQEGEE